MPWPPSVNNYWRPWKGRMVLTKKGRDYKKEVYVKIYKNLAKKFGDSRVRVVIRAYPPDNRRRDIDNICKAVLDAIGDCGIYNDDSQIDDLRVIRETKRINGLVEVSLIEITT